MAIVRLTPLRLERPIDLLELGANLFVLSEDYRVRWDDDEYTIPAGYRTDGASVPGAVPGGIADRVTGIEASVVHDFMYENQTLPKEDADRLFDEMLEADPAVSDVTRILMVLALDSDIARQKYDPNWEPPIVGQDDDIDD